MGTPIEALCGFVWVPSRDPKQLPVCEKCKSVYEMYKAFNDGLRDTPKTDAVPRLRTRPDGPNCASARRCAPCSSHRIDEIMLVRFEFPKGTVWSTPGGGLEPGEDHLDALHRELVEEVGLVRARRSARTCGTASTSPRTWTGCTTVSAIATTSSTDRTIRADARAQLGAAPRREPARDPLVDASTRSSRATLRRHLVRTATPWASLLRSPGRPTAHRDLPSTPASDVHLGARHQMFVSRVWWLVRMIADC